MDTRTDTSTVGRRLKAARESRGLSATAAAKLADTDKGTWWRYEHDARLPSLDKLMAFARATGYTLDWLAMRRSPVIYRRPGASVD